MRLSRNFKLSEFIFSETALRHGIDNTLPPELTNNALRIARWLQTFRNRLCEKYGREMPIAITSGYRSPRLNKKVGGSKTSVHVYALAADINVIGLGVAQTQREVIELMQDCPYDQCIDEFHGWVHIGLAKDPELSRMENLTARKRIGRFGKITTAYTYV